LIWEKLETNPNIPKIYGHTSNVLRFQNQQYMMIVGNSNENYFFNLDDEKWVEFKIKTKKPKPRIHHSSSVHNNMLYIFGGKSLNEELLTFSDLWRFDISKLEWKEISFSNPLNPRFAVIQLSF
jgi:N-acetylneuraminic acid mutarotase